MSDPYFFGYGSLVNASTHNFTEALPARLKGWRRVWCHTTLRDVAFLSVRPDSDCEIEGVIAKVPGNDWAALDQREWAYQRHDVSEQINSNSPKPEVQVYAVPQSVFETSAVQHPILLSYLDVVVQGFLQLYGEAGGERFFATTEGWETPVLNDRLLPRYPRAQTLSDMEQDFVNAQLAQHGAKLINT